MVNLLPPNLVKKLRAGERVYHPQAARNEHLPPERWPAAYPLLAKTGQSRCRSCGELIPRGKVVLAVDLFLEGTPLNAYRPTTVYLHPEPCCDDPQARFATHRRELAEAREKRREDKLAARQRDRDGRYNRAIARHPQQ